ncbi:MAG: hypothetical protein NW241_04055 [Bacteroidia bacterium]|nr:hypothetical protein [Bacteroidia bacterium]
MDLNYFRHLSEPETELLLAAPAIITVLISGADHDQDEDEHEWAEKLVKYRTFTSEPQLHDYYEAAAERFSSELEDLVGGWSSERQEELQAELAEARPILDKLDPEFAKLLKQSWRSLAKKVAEAKGGVLGFGKISAEEAKLIDLPMLDA